MTSSRRALYDAILASPRETQQRAREFLIAADVYDEDEGVDVDALDEAHVAVLHTIVYGHPPDADATERTRRERSYRQYLTTRLAASARQDYAYLARRATRASSDLRRRVQECRANEWSVVVPFYVRPARHGDVDVGLGLHALVPFVRGQLISHFTGTIHHVRDTKEMEQWFKANEGRENYAIDVRHQGRIYCLSPLDPTDRYVLTHNYTAYINEPSPPPWKAREVVQLARSQRNGVARRFDCRTGEYTVELADGTHVRCHADDVASHPLRRPNAPPPAFRANCAWYDFPVPLVDLYRYLRPRTDAARQYVYERRPGVDACEVRYALKDVPSIYRYYSDTTAYISMTPAKVASLADGDLLVLRALVHEGLERVGQIVRRDDTGVVVRHVVAAHTLWRLPKRIFAGKVDNLVCARCASGTDRPDCPACTVVPFPVVHACSDVAAGEELLCQYKDRVARTRGMGCATSLRGDTFGPSWMDLTDRP